MTQDAWDILEKITENYNFLLFEQLEEEKIYQIISSKGLDISCKQGWNYDFEQEYCKIQSNSFIFLIRKEIKGSRKMYTFLSKDGIFTTWFMLTEGFREIKD